MKIFNRIREYQRHFVAVIFTLHAVFFPLHGFAQEKVNSLDLFLNDLDSLQADFNQTLIDAKGNVLEEAAGVLVMQNPGKFYWAYRSPYEQSIITDGKTLWIYDQDLEQVTIRDVTGSLNDTPAAILSGSEDLDKHYLVEDQGVIEGLNMFSLTPRDAENQFQKIHIGFHGKKLFLMVMYDNLGQITRVNFRNPVRNASVDTSRFTFSVPDDVDVIDDRGNSSKP